MRITPGLLQTPADDQDATATGRLYGCNKSGGSARFSATLTMTAATCGSFSMQGTGTFAWANGQSSTATLVFQQQDFAPQKYLVGGVITNGAYTNLLIHVYLRFTLVNTKSGQPLCTASNPAVKATFTNASSMQILTPDTPPTFPPNPSTSSTTTTTTVVSSDPTVTETWNGTLPRNPTPPRRMPSS